MLNWFFFQYKPSLCTVGRAGASHKACTDGTVQHDWYNHWNDNKLNFLLLIHVFQLNIPHINRVWAYVLETYLQTDMTISINIYSHRLFDFYVTLVLFLHKCLTSIKYYVTIYAAIMSVTDFCKTCSRKVQSFSTHIRCVNCCTKYHAKCVNLERTEVAGRELWYCPFCIQSIIPYTHIYNDDEYTAAILENIMNYPTSFEDINNKIFVPFEINDSDSPLSETDPDVQFYSENHYIH